MKTVKQILETTYLPKSGDEKKFWDKHVRKLLDHPVAEPTQFKASTKKSKTNPANRDEASSEGVYEAAFNDTHVHTKRADKEPVISRGIDPVTRKGINIVKKGATGEIKIGEEVELEEGITSMSDARLKFHATKGLPHGSYTRKEIEAEHNRRKKDEADGIAYAMVKPSLNEDADLDEKVNNPYAVGMAAAMKQTGDTPPLKKSTIMKGHEIAKSIKAEAMDPVGKADADIDNDGDVDKSDKYLHNRRKAIGKALANVSAKPKSQVSLKKAPWNEETDLDEAKAGHNAMVMAKNLSIIKTAIGKSSKESSEANHDKYKATTKNKEAFKEDVKDNSEQNHDAYKASNTKKQPPKSQVVEAADQLDELSPNTLHKYVKGAASSLAGNAAAAGAALGAGKLAPHDFTRWTKNRMKGIVSASGRLSDKANAVKEEAEQIDEKITEVSMKQLQKKFNDGTHEAMNDPKPGSHVELRNTTTGKRTTHYVKEETEELDEISRDLARSYIRKAGADNAERKTDVMKPFPLKDMEKNVSAFNKMKSRQAGIETAGKKAYGIGGKARVNATEEVEQIDEIGDTPAGRKALKAVIARAPEKATNARMRSDILGRRQFDPDVSSADSERYGHAADKHYRKYQLSVKGAARAVDRLTKEDLDEAFKAGQMKLNDGSSVTVSNDCAESLNSLFSQLNPANKAKMEERLMSSPKGYNEILSFAENING